MSPEPITGLVVVTVHSDMPPAQVPTWLSPGALYRERDIVDWLQATDAYDLVATGEVDLHPTHADPLPVYEIGPVIRRD